MITRKSCSNITAIALLIVFGVLSRAASAECGCPGGGVGAPVVKSGLGQQFPSAPNLAANPRWSVYEFERDGIRYTQINDRNGGVRAAVGRIGTTFWVMPIGTDADRVVIQGEATPVGTSSTLYRSDEVEVLLYQNGTRQDWVVRRPGASSN